MMRLVKRNGPALLVAAVAILAVPGRAGATTIPPGGMTNFIPVELVAGPIVADTGLLHYTFSPGPGTGTVQEAVFADPFNPFGAGDLTFVLQVTALSGDGDVDTVSLSSVDTLPLDVAQLNVLHAPFPTPGIFFPSSADRLSPGVINFTIEAPGGMPDVSGFSTVLFITHTPVRSFVGGTIVVGGDNVDDVAGSASLPGFAPGSPVPEPASLLLVGTGLVAGVNRWRKRRPVA